MAYKTRFFEHIYLEAFVSGQVEKEVALGLATQLEDLLQLSQQNQLQTKTAFGLIDQALSDLSGKNLSVS